MHLDRPCFCASGRRGNDRAAMPAHGRARCGEHSILRIPRGLPTRRAATDDRSRACVEQCLRTSPESWRWDERRGCALKLSRPGATSPPVFPRCDMSEPACWEAHRAVPPFSAIISLRSRACAAAPKRPAALEQQATRLPSDDLPAAPAAVHGQTRSSSSPSGTCSLAEPASPAARYTIISLNFNRTPPSLPLASPHSPALISHRLPP